MCRARMNSPSATAPGSEGAPVMRKETPSGRRSVFMKSSHLCGQQAGSGLGQLALQSLSQRQTVIQAAPSFGQPRPASAACAALAGRIGLGFHMASHSASGTIPDSR